MIIRPNHPILADRSGFAESSGNHPAPARNHPMGRQEKA
jgi:hypothetical protein